MVFVVAVGWILLLERRAIVVKLKASFDVLGVDGDIAELVVGVDADAFVGGGHRWMVNSHCYCTCHYRHHLFKKKNASIYF